MAVRTVPAEPPLLKPYLRVAAYCRVSSSKEEQRFSLDAQISYYKRLIDGNPQWSSSVVYADQASGRSNRKMKQLQKLLYACRNSEIDLILVKSISRFGRNTLELLVVFRELRDRNIDVFFELENIHLKDQKSELLLTVYASMAQEQSESNSYCIRWGIRKDFIDGSSKFISRICYGYEHDDHGNLIINPGQAIVVKRIFEMHQSRASLRQISVFLLANHIPAPRGGQNGTQKLYGNFLIMKSIMDMFACRKLLCLITLIVNKKPTMVS